MTNRNASQGKSPYAKQGKAPFRYSDEFYNWAGAVDKYGHDSDEAVEADRKFRNKFGVPQATFA